MTCLIVGLPWGQFQGWSSVAMWSTIFFISALDKAVPIITDFRQAREANIFRTREGRTSVPGGREIKVDGRKELMKLIAFFEVLSFLILGPIPTHNFREHVTFMVIDNAYSSSLDARLFLRSYYFRWIKVHINNTSITAGLVLFFDHI